MLHHKHLFPVLAGLFAVSPLPTASAAAALGCSTVGTTLAGRTGPCSDGCRTPFLSDGDDDYYEELFPGQSDGEDATANTARSTPDSGDNTLGRTAGHLPITAENLLAMDPLPGRSPWVKRPPTPSLSESTLFGFRCYRST